MANTSHSSEYLITQENELPDKFDSHINPFWQSQVIQKKLAGEQQVPIHAAWVIHPDSKGSIVISSGRTEGSVKYKEVIYDLFQNGYSVFTLDHRGQGQSGRMADNADKGHVEDYAFYVEDLHTFISEIVLPNSQTQPQFLCHSMGCAIGALYLLSYPETFQKVVFSSPMFGINAPIPHWLAKGILSTHGFFNNLFSDQPWYFPGQGDKHAEPFEGNGVTHSKARYQQSVAALSELNIELGGITGGWLKASLWAMEHIVEQANDIKASVLLLQAGGDKIVDNDMQQVVCEKLTSCQLVTVPEAKHELLMEQDQYRNVAMTQILNFLMQNKDH